MVNTTIVIKGVDTKEGTSQKTGKPWRAYKVHAASGATFDTFDAGMGQRAAGAIGQTAEIEYAENDRGYLDLKSLTLTGNAPAPAPEETVVRDRDVNGNADWDLIGLRKTRCALWAAILSSNTFHTDVPAASAAAFARELVIAAEIDIFHRDPAQDGDDIPF